MSEAHEMPRSRRKNVLIGATFAMLAVCVAAMFAFRVSGGELDFLYWVGAVAATLSLALSFAWMHALDEVSLRAHVDAWFWGGLLGLSVLACGLVFALPALLEGATALAVTLCGRADAASGFMIGVAATAIVPTLGYLIWWSVFWLRRR